MDNNLDFTKSHATPRLLEGMHYVPAVATDVRKTWERFGYKAPSEQPKDGSK